MMINQTDTGFRDRAILVMDSQALGMVGVVRSLGKAGYRVHAASCQPGALGCASKFARASAQHPDYSSEQFLPWLRDYVDRHRIDAIVPSEAFLHAITSVYNEFRHLIPDAVPLDVWRRCLSKVESQRRLLEVDPRGIGLPPGGVVTTNGPLPSIEKINSIAKPYYLKADAGQGIDRDKAVIKRCMSARELQDAIAELQPHYRNVLWQGYATGQKVGVSIWRHQGEFMAENMTLGLHMEPHTGGMMSLRRTFWHDAILADAKSKMAALGWQGVAMMEYKWNPDTDEFWFIEINSRFWGYLHLDLYAGKDFPRLQMDGFFGRLERDCGPARHQVSCRNTVTGEIGYLVSLLKDRDVHSLTKLREFLLFCALFLHPTLRADLLFPGDRGLYWLAWRQYLFGTTR
jgi:hypothetical protein